MLHFTYTKHASYKSGFVQAIVTEQCYSQYSASVALLLELYKSINGHGFMQACKCSTSLVSLCGDHCGTLHIPQPLPNIYCHRLSQLYFFTEYVVWVATPHRKVLLILCYLLYQMFIFYFILMNSTYVGC